MLRPGKQAPVSFPTTDDFTTQTNTHRSSTQKYPRTLIFGLSVCIFIFILYVESLSRDDDPKHQTQTSNEEVVKISSTEENKNAENVIDGNIPLLDKDGKLYHLIFSTDCSDFQHWQSYLLFYSAFKVKQTGFVTRIASGCTEEQSALEMSWHNKHIRSTMSSRFQLHLTPHFSSVTKDGQTVGDYKFFNKPFGLRHWIENGEGMGEDRDLDAIVILVDPDMILLRPITYDFSDDRETLVGIRASEDRKFKVSSGQPFAQTYGLGAQWRTFHLDTIAGPDSPAKAVSQRDAGVHFPAGPPYLATVRDMYDIAIKWTEFAPHVHAEYPYLLAEMYAYCIAAAHLQLPHQLIDSLMVSNVDASGEGWAFVDAIPEQELCFIAQNPQHDKYPVPNVIHYCQRYAIGKWFFSKRRMIKDFFSCESPYLNDPPRSVIVENESQLFPENQSQSLSLMKRKREGFMVCGIIGHLNEAAKFFKDHAGCSNTHELAARIDLT